MDWIWAPAKRGQGDLSLRKKRMETPSLPGEKIRWERRELSPGHVDLEMGTRSVHVDLSVKTVWFRSSTDSELEIHICKSKAAKSCF